MFCKTKMQKYTENHNIRLSKIQKETLSKLKIKGYNVNQFIRLAIKEKIQREYKELISNQTDTFCPF